MTTYHKGENMKVGIKMLAATLAVGAGLGVSAVQKPPAVFAPGSIVLFQGDSITDGVHLGDMNHVYGHSYVWEIASRYQAARPEDHLQFANRGKSGDTSSNLVERWSTDAFPYTITENGYEGALGLKKGEKVVPDCVSVLVGINDYFHFIRKDPKGVSCEDFEANLRKLVKEAKAANPGVTLVLCEPFRIPTDVSPEFCRRQDVVAKLAAECNCAFVPFQKLFSEDLLKLNANPRYWFWDFFHPTPAGHIKMADFWIDTVAAFRPWGRNTALIPRAKLENDSYDWYARHEQVVKTQKQLDPEIVFIGDSITHGWEAVDERRGDVKTCFAKWFGKYRTLNMGFGWDRIQNVLWRLSHGEMDGTKPRVVVIHIGTNNTAPGYLKPFPENKPDEIADGVLAVCRRVREKAPYAKIVLMKTFPRGRTAADPYRAKVAAVNASLDKKLVGFKDANLAVLDLTDKYVSADGSIPPELMFDALHPTVKGYDVWGAALQPILEAEFGRAVTSLDEKLYRADAWVTSVDSCWGFRRTHVDFKGMDGWIVEPKNPKGHGEWVWCMKWPGAFAEGTGQINALERGYHYVYLDNRLWMNEEGTKIAKAWRDFLVNKVGLAPKVNLIGMSWGGFYSTRYAANYPEDVAKIYYDCPLLNFDGFPIETSHWGGAAKAWKREKGHVWGTDPLMPVNLADKIAAAKIPVFLLYGGKDTTVPPAKNSELFIARYKAAGGTNMKVVCRPENNHHPHGFTDKSDNGKVVDFFEE